MRMIPVGNPTSAAPTEDYIGKGKFEVRFRQTSESQTPVIEIIDHVAKTIKRIHVNNWGYSRRPHRFLKAKFDEKLDTKKAWLNGSFQNQRSQKTFADFF